MNNGTSNVPQPMIIPKHNAKMLLWLLLFSVFLFMLGIFLPMITISKFIFIKHSFSIISGIIELIHNGQYILFALVAGFSIILPVMKIHILYKLLSQAKIDTPKMKRYLHLMHEYGRWAMLDVMVVAVLIVTVKLGAIASIKVHIGLFIFGAAVLLIMLITNKVVHLTNKVDITST